MNCTLCNKKCKEDLKLKNFLYEGRDFVVCKGCKKDYDEHNIESISKKVEKNPLYDIDKHTIRGGL